MKALLITHSRDHFTIDRVAAAVAARGVEPVRIDTDHYPSVVGLDARIGRDGIAPVATVASGAIEPDDVVGIWCRRLAVAPRLEGVDPEMAMACARESAAARDLWLATFEARSINWVNRTDRVAAAENKGRQLAAARAEGLRIPETLVSNRPEAVRGFWDHLGGRVVGKMLTPYAMSMNGDRPFMYTSAISKADLDDLDGLATCPMVFQEHVAKDHELRVVVVGDRVFAGAIDARRSDDGQVDWRRAAVGDVRWTPGVVDDALATRLCGVVRRLGLVYGAADVIITPDGEPVFLEVNPGGEWGMLEHQLGHDISSAIADALIRPLETNR